MSSIFLYSLHFFNFRALCCSFTARKPYWCECQRKRKAHSKPNEIPTYDFSQQMGQDIYLTLHIRQNLSEFLPEKGKKKEISWVIPAKELRKLVLKTLPCEALEVKMPRRLLRAILIRVENQHSVLVRFFPACGCG